MNTQKFVVNRSMELEEEMNRNELKLLGKEKIRRKQNEYSQN